MPRNLCNCPHCQTDNCPAATDYAEIVAALEALQRSKVSSSSWIDALAQRWERRENDENTTHDEAEVFKYCARELRQAEAVVAALRGVARLLKPSRWPSGGSELPREL